MEHAQEITKKWVEAANSQICRNGQKSDQNRVQIDIVGMNLKNNEDYMIFMSLVDLIGILQTFIQFSTPGRQGSGPTKLLKNN